MTPSDETLSGTPSPHDLSGACHPDADRAVVQIRVLGPVELVVGGRVVSVRSSRTRRLLAMLTLHCDRVVSADRLADAVWGESLPVDPTAALHSQISRLRAFLGGAASAIETSSGGYRLRAEEAAVDLVAFDAAIAAAFDEPVPARRARLLNRAVEMVRGAAFEDLDLDDACIEARRVAELVVAAREDLSAARMEAATATRPAGRRLPVPIVEVIGRDSDLAVLAGLLESKRLVTLTGPGGVGKSTLALVAVARHCHLAGLHSAFVDLTAVAAHEDVPAAFARALGVERSGTQRWADRLVEAAGDDRLVLLVDSAEHVASAAAMLIMELVTTTQVVVVTTSRVALGIPGEHRWVVEPLDDAEAAIDLFMQRARSAQPRWTASLAETELVRDICRSLDGLPLAIELAAAQLGWRTLGAIRESLARPLDALQQVPPSSGRHGGLRTVIEDSYRLLDPAQRSFFDGLGVFAGGFTASTASQVCSAPESAVDEAARQVGALVERSLVRVDMRSKRTRYSLLDTVRHYALERLARQDALRATRDRHAAAMLELAEQAAAEMWGPDEPAWVLRLDVERADICAAHRHLVAQGDHERAVRLATASYWIAWPHGWGDLRALIGESVSLQAVEASHVRALALGTAADLALHDGDPSRAAELASAGLTAAGGRPELSYLANAVLGDIALFAGDSTTAASMWRAASEGYLRAAPALEPWAAAAEALAHLYGGHTPEAELGAAKALKDADACGCPTVQAFARYVAAEVCASAAPERAMALLAEAMTIASSASAAFVANLARLTLATLTCRSGDPVTAAGLYPAVLQEWRRGGQWAQQWTTLRTLVPVLAAAGAEGEAAVLIGGLRSHGKAETWGRDAAELRHTEGQIQEALGDVLDERLAAGAALAPSELVLFAERASRSKSELKADDGGEARPEA